EILIGVVCRLDAKLQIAVALQAAALAAIGVELRYRDTRGNAGVAAAALRAINVTAGAAEAARQCRIVYLWKMWRCRIDHQIARRTLREVAARVRQRLEQPDEIGLHVCILAPNARRAERRRFYKMP